MALQGTQQELVDNILKAYLTMEVPDENGNLREVKYPLVGEANISYSTKPNVNTGSSGVSGTDTTLAEALAAIVSEKTINHIIEKYEAAWQQRFEALETDFNSLLAGLLPVAVAMQPLGMPPGLGAVSGNALLAAVNSVKGPGRVASSELLKAQEKLQSFNTGNI
jgi:hypothetical protein